MTFLVRSLHFLDRHSGLISAVGLVLAAAGLLLTVYYLQLYRREIKNQGVEQERLAWERILKLLHQVAKYGVMANLSSVNHSPHVKTHGFLPPDLAAEYRSAAENLLSYWLQLKVELDIMPDSPLIDNVQGFIAKYDQSADSRATVQFVPDLTPIIHEVAKKAEKSFGNRGGKKAEG
jgi:hypothetical protein